MIAAGEFVVKEASGSWIGRDFSGTSPPLRPAHLHHRISAGENSPTTTPPRLPHTGPPDDSASPPSQDSLHALRRTLPHRTPSTHPHCAHDSLTTSSLPDGSLVQPSLHDSLHTSSPTGLPPALDSSRTAQDSQSTHRGTPRSCGWTGSPVSPLPGPPPHPLCTGGGRHLAHLPSQDPPHTYPRCTEDPTLTGGLPPHIRAAHLP